jgi:cytochrome oxidase Cu insertion factor (SCO1/SenC/PrrC family)
LRRVSDTKNTNNSSDSRTESTIARLVGRPWFWIATVLLIAAWPITRALINAPPSEPESVGQVGVFELINQYGKPFGSAQLSRRVWIAGIVCTQCSIADPKLAQRLKDVQHRCRHLGDRFKIVSFSVAPAVDTPAALEVYSQTLKASRHMWIFLTQPSRPTVMTDVVRDIFEDSPDYRKARASARPDEPDPLLPHVVALIDSNREIRGYFDLRDDESVAQLLHAAGVVLNKSMSRGEVGFR